MEIVFNNKVIPQDSASWQTAFNGGPNVRLHTWGQDNAPDRSARCLAHYICDMNGMYTIKSIIEEIAGAVSINKVYPESLVQFDEYTKWPRHHDLAFFSEDKKVFVSIEAKVAESFGKTFSVWLSEKESVIRRNRRDSLMKFFGVDDDTLYNQLLFGLRSTITGIFKTGKTVLGPIDSADYHIMLVLVFDSPEADKKEIANNKREFDRFIKAMDARRLDKIEQCECYGVPVGTNNYIAYKKLSYPTAKQ